MKGFISKHYRKKDETADEGGFTLIELLIVVLILGILAAIVAFAVGAFTSQSAVSACNTDAKSIESAVAAYGAANPGSAAPTSPTNLTSSANGGPYLHSFPSNPNYYYMSVNASGNVLVGLSANDPAKKSDGYTTTGMSGSAVNYDTFTWPGTTSAIHGQNVCAGA